MVTVVAFPGVAHASHGGEANSGTPDNADHSVDRKDLTSGSDLATRHGIAELNRSNMNATLDGSGDVEVYDKYYGTDDEWANDVGAITNCADWNFFYTECDVYRVRYNLSSALGNASDDLWRSSGCHEMGHTAGMGHRTSDTDSNNNSCMRKCASESRKNYDTHDIDAINSEID